MAGKVGRNRMFSLQILTVFLVIFTCNAGKISLFVIMLVLRGITLILCVL